MNFRKFILGSSSPRKKSKTGLMTLIDFQKRHIEHTLSGHFHHRISLDFNVFLLQWQPVQYLLNLTIPKIPVVAVILLIPGHLNAFLL